MTSHLLKIKRFDNECNQRHPALRAYLVSSTAPINVEDVEDKQDKAETEDPDRVLEEIANYLNHPDGNAEILILIHGYNTAESGATEWYQRAYEYMRDHYQQQVCPRFLILGYRWSSERIFQDPPGGLVKNLLHYFQLLGNLLKMFVGFPLLLAIAGIAGTILTIVGILFAIFQLLGGFTVLLTVILLIVASLIAVPVLTIFVLRVSAYFRDTYRATHYGVSDLVELIRQLDDQLLGKIPTQNRNENQAYWDNDKNRDRRIRLSFIGHSMGAYVVTNAVRIVSDVFDRRSIGKLDLNNRKKSPSSEIGNVFRLGRLVLVAPDISAETIISGRGNSLRSSLRRFDEAYLFSNEGDMVLKLASTAANSFTFPAKTRDGGYRLGNVIVRGSELGRGIVNFNSQNQFVPLRGISFLNCLAIRQGMSLGKRQQKVNPLEDKEIRSIAELFTYFDCTDYQENHKGIVSKALRKPFLSWFDSISLLFSKIDGHGGLLYGDAAFSQQLIYGLSCLGFAKFLYTLDSQERNKLELLQILSQKCKSKGIQVLLAAERYELDVLDQRDQRDQRDY